MITTCNNQDRPVATREQILRTQLLAWYDVHARDLPWRETRDPYRVWLSEIMLQQTRVAAVISHYHEFLRRFPTVEKLARAREASVLAAWSGLGYYRRARMMRAAAKIVALTMKGKFPTTAEELRALPGIGRYTAAAIASIAFGEPVAVVDGNVERVLQRISGRTLAPKDLWQQAEQLLDRERPGDFNQAMMELGATVCTPRGPSCLTCPVVQLCTTRGEIMATTKAVQQKKQEIHYALQLRNRDVFLVQRARDANLMAGMWELPELDGLAVRAKNKQVRRFARNDESIPRRRNVIDRDGNDRGQPDLLFTVKHSITVTDYTVHVWRRPASDAESGKWIASRQLAKLAVTGLARKILRRSGLMI